MPYTLVNEIEYYYEINGDGKPILFIHGLGSSTRDWSFQVDYFSSQFKVVTFDVRGHGRSEAPPGPYSVPMFASDTAELIATLQLIPTFVVGISMGGMIAFQLALDRPDLVKGMVIVNSAPELIVRTINDRLELIKRRLIVRFIGMRKMGEVLSERLLPKEDQKELRERFAQHWAENNPRAYRDAMNALVGWSVSDRLGEIDCPVLIVSADEDYTPIEFKQAYTERISGAELVVVEDSRHATPIDQADKLNRVIMDFITRYER